MIRYCSLTLLFCCSFFSALADPYQEKALYALSSLRFLLDQESDPAIPFSEQEIDTLWKEAIDYAGFISADVRLAEGCYHKHLKVKTLNYLDQAREQILDSIFTKDGSIARSHKRKKYPNFEDNPL